MSVRPDEVAEDEELARRCGRKCVRRSDQSIKHQAFLASTYPFLISTWRARYVELSTKRVRASDAFACVVAGEVESRPMFELDPDDDPPGHVNIVVRPTDATDPAAITTKEQLQNEAALFRLHVDCCKLLASMAHVCEG